LEEVGVIGKNAAGERQDGVVGAFSFGRGYGTLIGVLGGLRVPRYFPPPQEWKGALA
jgi:hypothetical protein